MPIAMYQLTVPILTAKLNNLIAILEKAAAFEETKKIDSDILPNSRLAPDMFALARQVQIVSDGVKGGLARLAGLEPPSWPDDEKTIAELIVRVQKTIEYANSFTPAQIDGSEDKTIKLKYGTHEFTFIGMDFLQKMVLPNFYFHLTTAYNILRHNGVALDKGDFLGQTQ